jgi:hypothetical protein
MVERIGAYEIADLEELALHKDIKKKTNIGSYCYIENNILHITNAEKYTECVNEYWVGELS